MKLKHHDVVNGAFFIVVGLVFFGYSIFLLDVGSATSMGSGFFPASVGLVLIAIGGLVAFQGMIQPATLAATIPWHGLLFLTLALLLFAVTVEGAGFAPSLAMLVFVSVWANPNATLKLALSVTACLTVLTLLIFKWALDLPIQLFGRWLGV